MKQFIFIAFFIYLIHFLVFIIKFNKIPTKAKLKPDTLKKPNNAISSIPIPKTSIMDIINRFLLFI